MIQTSSQIRVISFYFFPFKMIPLLFVNLMISVLSKSLIINIGLLRNFESVKDNFEQNLLRPIRKDSETILVFCVDKNFTYPNSLIFVHENVNHQFTRFNKCWNEIKSSNILDSVDIIIRTRPDLIYHKEIKMDDYNKSYFYSKMRILKVIPLHINNKILRIKHFSFPLNVLIQENPVTILFWMTNLH